MKAIAIVMINVVIFILFLFYIFRASFIYVFIKYTMKHMPENELIKNDVDIMFSTLCMKLKRFIFLNRIYSG